MFFEDLISFFFLSCENSSRYTLAVPALGPTSVVSENLFCLVSSPLYSSWEIKLKKK